MNYGPKTTAPVEICFARLYKSDVEIIAGLLDAEEVDHVVVKSKHTTREKIGKYDPDLPWDANYVKRTTDRILIIRGEDKPAVTGMMEDYGIEGIGWEEITYGINSKWYGGTWCYRTQGGKLKVRIRQKKFSLDPDTLERID